MVTEASASGRVASALRRRGAEVWSLPTVEIVPPDDWDDVDAALADWARYDWAIFTSGNAVKAVTGRLKALGLPDAQPPPRIAVVGSATARLVESLGWRASVRPAERSAEGLVATIMEREPLDGKWVLFPKGNIAREVVPESLRRAGATVRETVVYRTVPAKTDAEAVRRRLRSGGAAAITFTSPSAAEFFVDALGRRIWVELPDSLVVASIGPTTSGKLRSLGRPPDVEATEPSAEALAEAVASALGRTGETG